MTKAQIILTSPLFFSIVFISPHSLSLSSNPLSFPCSSVFYLDVSLSPSHFLTQHLGLPGLFSLSKYFRAQPSPNSIAYQFRFESFLSIAERQIIIKASDFVFRNTFLSLIF